MGFIDAETDLGLIPWDPDAANHNTTGLNAFFNSWGAGTSGNRDTLLFPGSTYFINNTIVTPQRWGGKIIGNGIADRRNYLSHFYSGNFGGAATQLVWYGGPTGVPIMRVRGAGLSIEGITLVGRMPYAGSDYSDFTFLGSGVSSGLRATCGLAIWSDFEGGNMPGKLHIPQISILNCDIGMQFGHKVSGTHGDNSLIGYYESHDNRIAVAFHDRQSNGHNFEYIEFTDFEIADTSTTGNYVFYCDVDSSNQMAGGALTCQNLKVLSKSTVLRLTRPSSNGSFFTINNIKFDNFASGWRLLDMDEAGHCYITMRGWAGESTRYGSNPVNILTGNSSFAPIQEIDINIVGANQSGLNSIRYYKGPSNYEFVASGLAKLAPNFISSNTGGLNSYCTGVSNSLQQLDIQLSAIDTDILELQNATGTIEIQLSAIDSTTVIISGNLNTTGSNLLSLITSLSGYTTGSVNTLTLNLDLTGSNLQGQINTTNSNLVATGQTLLALINTISGATGVSGAAYLSSLIVDLSGQLVSTGSNLFNLITILSGNLITTGSNLQIQINSSNNSINVLSGNLITTGSDLNLLINTLSGLSVNSINTLSGNLISTGSNLQNQITALSGIDNILSGRLNGLSGYTTNSINILSGQINNLSGLFVLDSGRITTLSGYIDNQISSVNSTISILSGSINSLENYINSPSGLVYTGLQALCPSITSINYICNGLLTTGGSINGPASGIVFSGIQDLCGLSTIGAICSGLQNHVNDISTINSSLNSINTEIDTILDYLSDLAVSGIQPSSGVVYSGLMSLCPAACSGIDNICAGLRILCFTPTEILNWFDVAIQPLRILINDYETPYEYTDEVLIDLLTTAANYVIQEVNLNIDYTVDITTNTITPDPINDPIFTNFVVLKAACLTNTWRFNNKAIAEGIKAKLGISEFSQFAGKDVILGLVKEGPCKTYNDLVAQQNFGNSDSIRTILSPFISNNFSRG